MEKTNLLITAREEIADAQTSQALDLVADFLKKEPKYKTLYREAVHLSALYSKTKQDEDKALISFENAKLSYSQVNNGLLNLLEYLENDNLEPASLLSPAPASIWAANKWWIFFVLGGVVLGALGVVVYKLLDKDALVQQQEPPTEEPTEPIPFACPPPFKGNNESILLLPFYKPGGDPIQPEGLFVERLEEFSQRINLKSDIRICDNFPAKRLLNFDEVDSFGIINNAKMLIWGRAEKSNNTTVVKTRYKYLGAIDTLPLTQLKWRGESQIATDKVLSIITSQGELTQDIEATLMFVVGMVAQLSGQREGATEALSSIRLKAGNADDSSAILTKNMILADNFLAAKQPAKAQAALDTVLKTHPNYWLGRNNRAILRMQNDDQLGAIDDLTVALVKKPEDPDLLLARGKAYQNSQQLYPAREDFEKVAKANPSRSSEVQDALKQTNAEIARLEKIIIRTNAKTSPNVEKKEIIRAADASNKLGDSRTTGQLVARGLELAPDDPNLIAIQIDNLLKEKKVDEAKKIVKRALANKVKREDISQHSVEAAKLIRQMSIKKEIPK